LLSRPTLESARWQAERLLAPIVVRISENARDGYSPGRIVDSVVADDFPSPPGGRWNRATVRNILENPAYKASGTASAPLTDCRSEALERGE